MITIGIDPGIEKTGIGIIKSEKQKLSLVYHKLIKTSSLDSRSRRLNIIYNELLEIINLFPADCAAIEKLFFAKNVKTAMTVSEVRGVIILALEQKKIPVYEYTPLQVKNGLVGYGRAKKEQIQELVRMILNVEEKFTDDVADGIALAIIHINTQKTLSKIKQNKRE